jgi:formyltetrahydrofolate deformylase
MRTRFETEQTFAQAEITLASGLSAFNPRITLRPVEEKKRALILVTSESHCLRDLLYLQELGELPIEIPKVFSNHDTLRTLVESHGIPFHFLDVKKNGKDGTEEELLKAVSEESVDFVILARYMQILSTNFCDQLSGRIINIHHSFLPGFKGAKPYHQAHDRGVKIIGATAHFVTADLDEGPIIEQDVSRT